jgi:hypothetical protein
VLAKTSSNSAVIKSVFAKRVLKPKQIMTLLAKASGKLLRCFL